MIEYLVALDIEAFKILNGAFNPFLDHFMWLVSGKFAWILMCIALLYVVFRNNWKNGVVSLLFLALTITLSDQISSTFIKHTYTHRGTYALGAYRQWLRRRFIWIRVEPCCQFIWGGNVSCTYVQAATIQSVDIFVGSSPFI